EPGLHGGPGPEDVRGGRAQGGGRRAQARRGEQAHAPPQARRRRLSVFEVGPLGGRLTDRPDRSRTMIRTPHVAYFCMEYGLDESFPIYSGGLGILAGDFIKS